MTTRSHSASRAPGGRGGVALLLCLALTVFSRPAYAAVVDTTLYRAVDTRFSGARAFEDVRFFTRYWRIAGSAAFNTCLAHTVEQLEEAGFRKDDAGGARYRIDEAPLENPVWTPLGGELRLDKPRKQVLHTFDATPVMLCRNSFPTKVTADVVFVGDGTRDADYRGVEVKGRIVLGRGRPAQLYKEAVMKRGARGILSGNIADYNRPDRFPDAIRDGKIPYDPERRAFGMMVSRRTMNALIGYLRRGKRVRVRARVAASFAPGKLRTLVAEIPGTAAPDERVVVMGHIDHYKPGANDNASGAAAVLEIARTAAALIDQGAMPPPARTITFLWVDEYAGTRLWMRKHPEAVQGVQAAFVLDMVGEKTEVTGGPFRVERMPDPSALWLRPPDEHTSWGAGEVDRADVHGHFLNDFYLAVCRQRAAATGWTVADNPWEGGSDHDLFLDRGRPAVLSWHFPDYFYHTSLDGLDKVSPEELKNVGVAVTAAALTLASPSGTTARRVLDAVAKQAAQRLDTEAQNSRAVMAKAHGNARDPDGRFAGEKEILSAWTQWYAEALDSVKDLPVGGVDDGLIRRIEEAKNSLRTRLRTVLSALRNDGRGR